jgi:DNA-binding transcriptional MerR regulator
MANRHKTGPQTYFTTGEMAERFHVSPESLRNWERQSLIPPVPRTPGGHRRYLAEHVAAIVKLHDTRAQPA